ncbi:MAG: Bifunctional protein FolD protein [Elusimicrobia bacterium]|nr:Bifunctional protein FolD protein [Elusimicrobiota bacterium]
MAQILDGKKISAEVYADIRRRCSELAKNNIKPGLATVLVGDDPASQVYVGQKIKKCQENGIESIHCPLPATISQEGVIQKVKELNENPKVNGMIVQLPLPKTIDPEPVINSIDPKKDADGLHPLNQGLLGRLKNWKEITQSGIPLSCTPYGVVQMLLHEKIQIQGKHAVIVGRSTLVGKPLAQLLLSLDATVTIAHSKTTDLIGMCRTADILVAALGQPEFIKGDWVKPGAVVIDVGISRTKEGLKGDVDFKAVSQVASWITPVPGGVGIMTVAMLLRNTVSLTEYH